MKTVRKPKEERIAQQGSQKNTQAPAWYATNGFKLAAGIAGIILLAALLFTLNAITPNTDNGAFGSANQNLNTGNGARGVAGSGGATADGTTQVIRMAVMSSSYVPSTLTVEAGKPVRWIIDGTKMSGCTTYIIAQEFGINRRLTAGENVIEFTPTKKGTFGFSCGMGMVRGTMNVI